MNISTDMLILVAVALAVGYYAGLVDVLGLKKKVAGSRAIAVKSAAAPVQPSMNDLMTMAMFKQLFPGAKLDPVDVPSTVENHHGDTVTLKANGHTIDVNPQTGATTITPTAPKVPATVAPAA